MSWMKYNKETGQIDLLPYISELSGFHAIVMDEHTWSNVICKRSASAAPGKAKGRKTKFLANLFELLLNAGNKLTGRFADGIQTILERFQVFVL